MPKSKSEMMKALYKSRKDAGLVEFRVWVTPEQAALLSIRYRKIIESAKLLAEISSH